MKKAFLPTLFLALILTFIFSCEKKQITSYVPEVLTGEEYLQSYFTPNILFMHVQVNEANQNADGWFVDNVGLIHKFNSIRLPFDISDNEIMKGEINMLYGASSSNGEKVNLDALVENYKTMRSLNANSFKISGNDESAPASVYIFGYDLSVDDQACIDCPGSPFSGDFFSQILLKSEGTVQGAIDNRNAQSVVEWLNELNSGL